MRRAASRREFFEKFIQVGDALFFHNDGVGGHSRHTEGDREDDPGQANSADGSAKQIVPLLGRTSRDASVRKKQIQPLYMVAEAAIPVVVLAVDIIGDEITPKVPMAMSHHGT